MKAKKLRAKLRGCASCEWIFEVDENSIDEGCPKCHFAHYSARCVYGNKAYRYKFTQKPWMNRKLADYSYKLWKEIKETNKIKKEIQF